MENVKVKVFFSTLMEEFIEVNGKMIRSMVMELNKDYKDIKDTG